MPRSMIPAPRVRRESFSNIVNHPLKLWYVRLIQHHFVRVLPLQTRLLRRPVYQTCNLQAPSRRGTNTTTKKNTLNLFPNIRLLDIWFARLNPPPWPRPLSDLAKLTPCLAPCPVMIGRVQSPRKFVTQLSDNHFIPQLKVNRNIAPANGVHQSQ